LKCAEKESADEKKPAGSGSIEVMLAQTYDPVKHDPSGWLMSEKMDGVRCYWNGSCLYTRTGGVINAPKEWKALLPRMALDGELWTGRDDFQNIVSIVRHKTPDSDDWKSIKFMIFDAPLIKGTFAERLVKIAEELAKEPNDVVKTIK